MATVLTFVGRKALIKALSVSYMWTCNQCGEVIEDQFDSCWKCSTAKGTVPPMIAPPEKAATPAPSVPIAPKWKMTYRMFRGTFVSWETLLNDASEFATSIGPERVVSISQSEDDSDGVVVVWYWTNVGGE